MRDEGTTCLLPRSPALHNRCLFRRHSHRFHRAMRQLAQRRAEGLEALGAEAQCQRNDRGKLLGQHQSAMGLNQQPQPCLLYTSRCV